MDQCTGLEHERCLSRENYGWRVVDVIMKHKLEKWLTCAVNIRSSSTKQLRRHDLIALAMSRGSTGHLAIRRVDPSQIISVFVAFRQSRFEAIYSLISPAHADRRTIREAQLCWSAWSYNGMSSAYTCAEKPCLSEMAIASTVGDLPNKLETRIGPKKHCPEDILG